MRFAWQVQYERHMRHAGDQGADFLRRVAFGSIGPSGLVRWFCMTGAALRMTWLNFIMASAVLKADGVENS